MGAGLRPNRLNFLDGVVERRRHQPMDLLGLVTLDEEWLVAVTLEELLQLLARNAGKKTRIGNFIAVQMEDGQHGSVAHGI